MEYSYTLYDSIDQISADEWALLRTGDRDPFHDRPFLRVLEATLKEEEKYRYAVLRDREGAPRAHVLLCLQPLDAAQFAQGRMRIWAERVARVFPRLLRVNLLYCDLTPGFVRFAAEVGPQAAIAALDRLTRDVAAEERAGWIIIKDLTDAEVHALRGLTDLGYAAFAKQPMNYALPAFGSFDEFCASVCSQHRWTIKRSRKKFAAAGMRVVQITGAEGADRIFTDDVYRLYEAVYDRAEYKLEKFPPEFFRELARQIPDHTSFTYVYDGDRVVAFTVSLFNEAIYRSLFCGVDYELNARSDLYFNLSFHMMDDAYRRGVSDEILVGYTTDSFKREKLGCSQRPVWFYARSTRPLVARLVRRRLARRAEAQISPPAPSERPRPAVPAPAAASTLAQ